MTPRVKHVRLTTVIGIAITGLTVLAALTVALFLHLNYDNRLTKEFHGKVRANSHQIGLALANRLSTVSRRLSELSLDNSVRVTLMLEVDHQLNERLRAHHGQPPGATFFIVPEGRAQVFSSDPRSRRYTKLVSAIIDTTIPVDRIFRTDEGEFFVGFSMPILKRAKRLGTAVCLYRFDLKTLWGKILDFESGARIIIQSRRGVLDLSSGRAVAVKAASSRTRAQDNLVQVSVDGVAGVLANVEGYPALRYFVPLASLNHARTQSLIIAVVVSLGVGAIGLLVAVLLANWIGNPLRNLAVSAHRLASGDATPAEISESYRILELDQFASSLIEIVANLKQAEELKRYQVLFDGLGEPVCIVNREGQVLEGNEIAPVTFGLERSEFLKKSIFDFVPKHFRDEFRSILETSWRDSTEMVFEGSCITAQCGTIDAEYRARQIDYDGSPVMLIVIINITARKRAEKELRASENRFRAFIDATPSAILMKDIEGQFILANKCWHDWFNPTVVEIAGKSVRDFYDEPHAGDIQAQDRQVVETGESVEREYETPFADGSVRSTWMQKFPIRDHDGEIIGIGGINTDITKQKETERFLRTAMEVAEYANRSKSEFLANMSHELRTPLNAIIGFSEMMCLETFGPVGGAQYREYVRDIYDSGTHLLSLINDILDLSKVEAGKLELYEEPVDIAKAVISCLRIVKERAKENGIQLANRLGGDLPRLFADERAVKQIVLNLLSNAIKFTPVGGKGTVHAEIDEDGCFAISVTDTGIGIDADDIPKMFTPFSQVDDSLTRKQEGTGLGLPLVKSLVEKHGGTIELESELGRGTTATIRFPAGRTNKSAVEARALA